MYLGGRVRREEEGKKVDAYEKVFLDRYGGTKRNKKDQGAEIEKRRTAEKGEAFRK